MAEPALKLPTCQECGDAFQAKRRDARFCSDSCRQRAHRKREGRSLLDVAKAYVDAGVLPGDLEDETDALVAMLTLLEFVADEDLCPLLAAMIERHRLENYP